MNRRIAPLIAAALAAAVFAQDPARPDTLGQLSKSAGAELATSVRELSELRDRISAEKLPMATELTALEQEVARLRKELDRVTRLADSGNLEISTVKTEIKARQDELTYVDNLLDEFVRTFETKVNVAEMQYCGDAIDAAKKATENNSLAPEEKTKRRLDVVGLSMKRLFDAVGGMRFPGSAVQLDGSVAEGQFALIGPVALFRSKAGQAGIVVPQTGSTKPLIRPLEGAMQLGIQNLVETGEGLMPLDPSFGGALKALVQKTSIVHIFIQGGPIMWPMLLASVVALATVLERLLFLFNERRKRDVKSRNRMMAELKVQDIAAALRTCETTRDYVCKAVAFAYSHKQDSLHDALEYASQRELKRFKRGISVLDTVITLAPLLGLLGTVTGMMGSFSLIGGDLGAPGAITGGIAEALIATAFGLGIAILCVLPFNYLNTRIEEIRHELDVTAAQVELYGAAGEPSVASATKAAALERVGA